MDTWCWWYLVSLLTLLVSFLFINRNIFTYILDNDHDILYVHKPIYWEIFNIYMLSISPHLNFFPSSATGTTQELALEHSIERNPARCTSTRVVFLPVRWGAVPRCRDGAPSPSPIEETNHRTGWSVMTRIELEWARPMRALRKNN
jgi:hypothetical protein